jgi:ribonuclease D
MQPITTTSSLAEACARMTRHPFVTVDTEFLRESTYYPRLCVAQMASTDEAIVIDTLAEGIDFAPFFALMANENVVKVFHAARQDIEICWHEAGIIPSPIIDTQVAAMVLGYGDAISYDQLVQRITGDSLDKSHRFTDWTRRPLSEAQLAYAISDVTHLRDVYLKLSADLDRRGRSDWMREEMKVLTSPATYRFEPEHAWERLKTRVRKPKELAVLIEVALGASAKLRSVTCLAAACSRTTSSATSRCRRPRRSSASRACVPCPEASNGRNGGKPSSRPSSVAWREIPRRCRGSNDRSPRSTDKRRWNCSRCCCA